MRITRIAVCFGLSFSVGTVLFAQHAHTAADPINLVLSIDGGKTPDLIPDDLAYRHFIKTMAQHQVPTPAELQYRAARLAHLGLSQTDSDALIAALTGVREQAESIAAQRQAAATDSSVTGSARDSVLASLKGQEDALYTSATSRLKRSLTVDGRAQLDKYIRQHVKPHIRVYALAQ